MQSVRYWHTGEHCICALKPAQYRNTLLVVIQAEPLPDSTAITGIGCPLGLGSTAYQYCKSKPHQYTLSLSLTCCLETVPFTPLCYFMT